MAKTHSPPKQQYRQKDTSYSLRVSAGAIPSVPSSQNFPGAVQCTRREGDMMKRFACLSLSLLLTVPVFAQQKEQQRIQDSYQVLKEIIGIPDKGIPQDLLDKSECVVIYPSVKKAAFIVGAEYGRGVITCRTGA